MAINIQSAEHKRNPEMIYGPLREAGALAEIKLPLLGAVSFVMRHGEVERVLKDHATFAVDPRSAGLKRRAGVPRWAPRFLRALTNNMVAVDEPEHKRLRSLVNQAFTRQSVEAMEANISRWTDAAFDQLEASEDHDWVRHVGRPIPMKVICELLGVPVEDRDRFSLWARSLLGGNVTRFGLVYALPRLFQIVRYLRKLAEARRIDPQDDLVSHIVHADAGGERLDDDEVSSMLNLLIIAGHETTVHLLNTGMAILADRPDLRARLRDAPELLPNLVEELLRVAVPFEIAGIRYATCDTEIGGQRVAKGQRLMPCLASANFDPRVFDDPEQVRLDRSTNPHLSFGAGIHYCLGVMLARLEARIVLGQALVRWPDVACALPEAERVWLPTLGLRGLKALPLRLHG